MPSATACPSTRPVTPFPGTERNASASASGSPRRMASATMAAASGCSEPFSRLAAKRRTSGSAWGAIATTFSTAGFPRVRVPVLSTRRTSTFSSRSSASAFLTSTPAAAPRPVPTMIAMGVASPSAHGQATMSTATDATRACARRGSGPIVAQTANATRAAKTTAGTNQPETTSASRWMGARLRCASITIRTIWARSVSFPTRSARMTNDPVPLSVAPVTRSPSRFSTGTGSPVTIDSSTADVPETATPSTGIFSPGRTRRRSPTCTCATSTSRSTPPSSSRRAVRGARARSARIAPETRRRATSSRIWPRRTSSTITAAASK